MDRLDWNLLALSAAGGEALTPVQLQKSLFLLAKNLPADVLGEDFYHFEPYNYGPFDSQVYTDASILTYLGLAASMQSSQGRWTEYKVTAEGMRRATEITAKLPAELAEYVGKIVRWVRAQSFTQLVSEIYRLYPETKVNSVFRG